MKLWPLILILVATPALADNLYKPSQWSALASDYRASQPGDSLTVMVLENATASNGVASGSRKSNRLRGNLDAGRRVDESITLDFGGTYDGNGQTSRSGRMVAQLSVAVDAVLLNGDLRISGVQQLNLNGERTRIALSGRVRRADISAANTIMSSRIADAIIEYDGKGFASRGAKPGIVTRIFRLFGLL